MHNVKVPSRFLHHPYWKHYADFLLMGINLGVCAPSDAITWADRLIERSDLPLDWMIALSVSTEDCYDRVIHSLGLVPGEANPEVSFRLLLTRIGKVHPILLSAGERFFQPAHSRLLVSLYHLGREQASLPETIRDGISQLYCDMDYVEEGGGNWTIVQQDYAELLSLGEPDNAK